MDFLIIYERKLRELENALLLKIELESRGYTCEIKQYYEVDKIPFFIRKKYKAILVPYLYVYKSIPRIFSRFGQADMLVNLQYEQVLSKKWEDIGHHNPHGEAKKAIHICWGDATKKRLVESGVSAENLEVLGALQLDLLRPEYRDEKDKLRQKFSKAYALDNQRKWNVFLSSFTYANISEDRLKMNESVANTDLSDFPRIHTQARDEILNWFESILQKDPENYLIYRPHPDELNLEPVEILAEKYPNFKIIREQAVKKWLEVVDNVYSWYSTSVIEAHFLNRGYSILRPTFLPDDFDSVLIKKAKFIVDYEQLEVQYFSGEIEQMAIKESDIQQYYRTDTEVPAFKKYVDFLEKCAQNDYKQVFSIQFKDKMKAKLTSMMIYFVYHLYKLFGKNKEYKDSQGFFGKWFLEFNNQIASEKEKEEIEIRIRKQLARFKN